MKSGIRLEENFIEREQKFILEGNRGAENEKDVKRREG